MSTLRFGSTEIISLLDTTFEMELEQVHPSAGGKPDQFARDHLDRAGRVQMPCHCFALRTDGQTILVDTGQGQGGQGLLPAQLSGAGIDPGVVDVVVTTHLHGDHTGWNLDPTSGAPYFPRARYVAPRADWLHYSALEPSSASFVRDVQPLMDLGRLELVDGGHQITESLSTLATPGHTPGHLSLELACGTQQVVILGDVVVSPLDALDPLLANGFDWDDAIALRTRTEVLGRLAATGQPVAAAHLPAPGLGTFAVQGSGFRWLPLARADR